MKLLSPKLYDFKIAKEYLLLLHFQRLLEVPGIYTQEKLIKAAHIMAAGDGREFVTNPVPIPIPRENTMPYFMVQNFINTCVNNAEAINHKILQLLFQIQRNDPTALTNKKDDTGPIPLSKKDIIKMDFMSRKNLFSDFVKKFEKLKSIEMFDTNLKIKNVTKVLNQFVLDRNIYTHGLLHLLLPEDVFILEHIEQEHIKYSEVSLEILKSFNRMYAKLSFFINLIDRLYQGADELAHESLQAYLSIND